MSSNRLSSRACCARDTLPGERGFASSQGTEDAAVPEAPLEGLSFWADSALLAEHMPTALFGPIGHGAHAVDEWVSRSSLARVYDAVRRAVEAHGGG